MCHPGGSGRITASPVRRRVRGPADASHKGGCWRSAPGLSAVSRGPSAWPLRHDPFFRSGRWDRAGCVPPLKSRGVRANGSTRARTRMGRLRRLVLSCCPTSFLDASPFHNDGLTKFEPLRLTHPVGVALFHLDRAARFPSGSISTSGASCRGLRRGAAHPPQP
jgi:hypothetical protein